LTTGLLTLVSIRHLVTIFATLLTPVTCACVSLLGFKGSIRLWFSSSGPSSQRQRKLRDKRKGEDEQRSDSIILSLATVTQATSSIADQT
jgi:hypothetical protein